jgi:hypothetical protein
MTYASGLIGAVVAFTPRLPKHGNRKVGSIRYNGSCGPSEQCSPSPCYRLVLIVRTCWINLDLTQEKLFIARLVSFLLTSGLLSPRVDVGVAMCKRRREAVTLDVSVYLLRSPVCFLGHVHPFEYSPFLRSPTCTNPNCPKY